jgi:hypothetical protein
MTEFKDIKLPPLPPRPSANREFAAHGELTPTNPRIFNFDTNDGNRTYASMEHIVRILIEDPKAKKEVEEALGVTFKASITPKDPVSDRPEESAIHPRTVVLETQEELSETEINKLRRRLLAFPLFKDSPK